ncbi:unnamed protein product [Calypogeia fissa]
MEEMEAGQEPFLTWFKGIDDTCNIPAKECMRPSATAPGLGMLRQNKDFVPDLTGKTLEEDVCTVLV